MSTITPLALARTRSTMKRAASTACCFDTRRLIMAVVQVGTRAVVLAGTEDAEGIAIKTHLIEDADFATNASLELDLIHDARMNAAGAEVEVFLQHWRLLRVLRDAGLSVLPGVTFHDHCPDHMRDLNAAVDRARQTSRDALRFPSVRGSTPLEPVTVATDASVRARRRGAGLCCIAESGQHAMRFVSSVADINVAELMAIELAIDTFRGKALTIRSDSQSAVTAIHCGTTHQSVPGSDRASRVVSRIVAKLRDTPARVLWIPGHNGDPLNESAHRLAVLARRTALTIPPEALTSITNNIKADLDAALTA